MQSTTHGKFQELKLEIDKARVRKHIINININTDEKKKVCDEKIVYNLVDKSQVYS